MSALRRRYGASPLHLAAHLASLALAGWALLGVLDLSNAARILIWLAAAVLLHDALLWPVYSGLDTLARRLGGAVNHVRVPAVLSGMLLLAYFPTVAGFSAEGFERTSGQPLEGSLARWLLASALLFGGSALAYAIRARGSGGRRPTGSR